ncbi:MAG: RnfABCDGE type electron transport complex subunit D [Clostridiales bacterium]|nr:RnfABCDGE type electron transport complex subunit D [Clostridiales bacterium]
METAAKSRFVVSGAPHARGGDSTREIMLDVIIALLPAAVMAAFYFGFDAALLMVIGGASALLFEILWNLAVKKPAVPGDLSAVVTGLLLAFNLPPNAPFWLPIVGSLFAIVVVKQLFGGLGQNFLNPALAGRAFLMASYPAIMTDYLAVMPNQFEGITSATPLQYIKANPDAQILSSDLLTAFIGQKYGVLGETCAVALLLGGLYLILRRVVNWRVPFFYLATVAALSYALGRAGSPVYDLLTGGVMLGAFFMATDFATSPVTPAGKVIFGVGCGALTMIIRTFSGAYPEGVSYSILLMNLTVPLIDRWTRPKTFGKGKAA